MFLSQLKSISSWAQASSLLLTDVSTVLCNRRQMMLPSRLIYRSSSQNEAESDQDRHDDWIDKLESETETYYDFHGKNFIPLTPIQKAIITVGSGLSSFFDPTKAENIATFGEISSGIVLRKLYENMMKNEEGALILMKKPRINSTTVDLDALAALPPRTLGREYIEFLERNNVTPDSRLPVRFIEDPELSYVMQRYREIHDLVHAVTGQPTNMLGEVVVKWIEGIQTGLPMCWTGGLFGATRLRPKQRQKYVKSHLNWAIRVGFSAKPFLNIFFEERWDQDIDELRSFISPLLLDPPS